MISLHLRGAKLMISIHLRGAKLYDPPPLRVQIYLGRFFKRSFLYGVTIRVNASRYNNFYLITLKIPLAISLMAYPC